MKKIHYSTIAAVALIVIAGASLAGAQTTTDTSSGRWSKYYEQRQKNLEQEKEKLGERKEKLASTTAKITARINEREDRIASTTAKLEVRNERVASSTEARKARLEDKFKTGVSNKIAKVVDTLGDAISRIKSIDTRIVAHIAKLKAKNINTSKAETLLVDAQAKLSTATQNVTALESSVNSILTGNISTSTKATVKAKIVSVQKSVKDAHAAYVTVTENLKSDKTETATSTATTTAQ